MKYAIITSETFPPLPFHYIWNSDGQMVWRSNGHLVTSRTVRQAMLSANLLWEKLSERRSVHIDVLSGREVSAINTWADKLYGDAEYDAEYDAHVAEMERQTDERFCY